MGKHDLDLTAERDRMREARAAAHAVLDANAELDALRLVARELGKSMKRTADDRGLWRALSKKSPDKLNAEQRAGLNAALDIDWVPFLNEIRYQPPPPVEVYGGAFVCAMRDVVEGRNPNVKSIRNKVRDLAKTLLRLSGDPNVTTSRLRRLLRQGARVAGSLIVVVGVAAAGIAVEAYVTLHTGDPVSGKIAGKAAEAAAGAAIRGAGKVCEKVLDVVMPEGPKGNDEAPADDAATQRAANQLYDEEADRKVRELAGQWAENVGNVAESKRFQEDAMRRLYILWLAADDAPWFTDDFPNQLQYVSDELTALRDALDEQKPDKETVVRLLTSLAAELPAAQTRVLAGVNAEIAARKQALEEQGPQQKHAESQRKHAELNRRSERFRNVTTPKQTGEQRPDDESS